MERKCVLCEMRRPIDKHHIIEVDDFGSLLNDNNLVYLCKNHHWLATLGTVEERNFILNQIKLITGKEGVQDINKKKFFKKLVIAWEENRLGKLSENEINNIENSFSYQFLKKECGIVSRNKFGISGEHIKLRRQQEITYAIWLLKKEMEKL